MIDYAFLCQAIDDWRAGRRPNLPPSATPTLPGSGVSSTAPIELVPEAAAEPMAAADEGDADVVYEDEQVDDVPVDEIGADELPVPDIASEGDAADGAAPPPDYDSTMVYGAGGETSWPQPADGEPTDR